ncbi:MAG: hypothetical protein Q3983_01005 [Capnocytophaga sp.]|nr:hypothetical protein [Capnocytophaga sp.]
MSTFLFYQKFYNIGIVEFICGTIFVSAYLLYPLFFVYQIIKLIRDKERERDFTISIIALVLLFLSVLFYIGLYQMIDRAVTNAYRNA